LKIVVAGMGYVGLSIACLLAQNNEVFAVDIVSDKVDLINRRITLFTDDEIERFFQTKNLKLKATGNLTDTFKDADYLIIATPTDYDEEQDFFDTSSVDSVIKQAAEYFIDTTVVIKSTLPVGYTEKLTLAYPNLKILVSPEFLREGQALHDNLHPSRIVVGVPKSRSDLMDNAKAFSLLLAEGAIADDEWLVSNDKQSGIACRNATDIPQLILGATEAEAVKLFSNTYLALRVSFFNELDTFAELRGLDTSQIIGGIGMDPRIGNYYNNPSFGYGGYCLPKDTKQLLANYTDIPQNLIKAIVEANQTRMDFVVSQITALKPTLVGVFRLIMKSNSDNFRQSSIQGIMERMQKQNIPFLVYEPLLDDSLSYEFDYTFDLDEFKRRCDIIIANRISADLSDVMDKTYSRDLWQRD